MNALVISDLAVGNDLDRAAMAELSGRGTIWEKLGSSISTGSWSGYSRRYSSYLGTVVKNGYLHRKYREGFKRTRTQTEYSTWHKYVKV